MKLTTRFSTLIFTLALICLAACEMAIPPFLPTDRPDNGGDSTIVADTVELDTVGWNIPAEALTIAEARAICAELESGAKTTQKYYVMGYVKKLHSKHPDGVANYGNAQFYMEDVKGANSSDDFMAYQVYGPNSQRITDPAAVEVGDFVVLYGALTNYNGTYETTGQGSAHIWKSTNPLLNGSSEEEENPDTPQDGTSELVIPEEAKAWNIPAEAIDVLEAREICAGLASGEKTTKKYYVMGYVKKLHSKHPDGVANYGNAQFYMENVKGANSSDDFMAYQVYGPNSQRITDPASVEAGDFVVIYGPLTNYNGTYETTGQGSAYIWNSTNPLLSNNQSNEPQEPEELVIPEEAKAWNIPAEAIDVLKAREICAALAAGDSTADKYYVMGYVKNLHSKHADGVANYGNAQFYMENVKGKNSQNDFVAFQVYGLNQTKITDPNCVKEGDFVVVYGKLTNYMGNTYETVGKGSAYIWKSTNPLMKEGKPEPKEVTIFEELIDTKSSFEKFTVKSVSGDAVWKFPGAKKKYAEMNGQNTANEDWLITPELDLTGMSEASISFKHKFSAAVPADLQGQYTVLVSKDYDGNVENISKATWVAVQGLSYDATAFTETGALSLPADVIGSKCYIAWKYTCSTTSHTWSMKEVTVKAMTKVEE